MINISYINGIGGNWLRRVILNYPTISTKGNFHRVFPRDEYFRDNEPLLLTHDFENFDYVYYGEYWFNFYLNQVYKLDHLDRNIFSTQSYRECFLQCMTETHIVKYRSLADQAFFKFEDLLFDTDKFLECVHHVQNQLQIEKVSRTSFLESRNNFFSTCVDVEDIYNNKDNTFWICYALGELQCLGFDPEFIVSDLANKERCVEFIEDHRHHLIQDMKIYKFNSGIVMPEFPTI